MDLAKASDQIDQLIERREKVVGELRRMAGTAEGEGAAMRPNARGIQDLERRALELAAGPSSGRSEAMKRLVAHLGRLAALRRGELSEEEEVEVRAADASIQRRMAEARGEGGLLG